MAKAINRNNNGTPNDRLIENWKIKESRNHTKKKVTKQIFIIRWDLGYSRSVSESKFSLDKFFHRIIIREIVNFLTIHQFDD